eukprot:CAMPEP_0170107488 /NCGR_PEP_ID=MMETSP0020_2-20130122/6003_1 /TAXON_ID=98059 /ORGANISM="Dinobryon sp., Strain UTEXLB2267" /LENGTH=48 /DNA_ID= /DNA_START= /DNA_END= /DNA_ORIENTATION=
MRLQMGLVEDTGSERLCRELLRISTDFPAFNPSLLPNVAAVSLHNGTS